MEMNEALSLASSIAGGIKDIKQACSVIPVGLFANKQKSELENKISLLEERINNGFPKLKQLIILYSDLKTDVSIARALSDKIAEIINLSTSVAPVYISALIGTSQTELIRIINRVKELPCLDMAEAGALIEKLDRIDRYILDIKNIIYDGDRKVEKNVKIIAKCFSDIATEYGGVEAKLSELLNKRILKDFEVFKT